MHSWRSFKFKILKLFVKLMCSYDGWWVSMSPPAPCWGSLCSPLCTSASCPGPRRWACRAAATPSRCHSPRSERRRKITTMMKNRSIIVKQLIFVTFCDLHVFFLSRSDISFYRFSTCIHFFFSILSFFSILASYWLSWSVMPAARESRGQKYKHNFFYRHSFTVVGNWPVGWPTYIVLLLRVRGMRDIFRILETLETPIQNQGRHEQFRIFREISRYSYFYTLRYVFAQKLFIRWIYLDWIRGFFFHF